MEGDEHRLGSLPHDQSGKRRSRDSGFSSSNQQQGESSSNCSINSATPGVQRMGASSVLAGPSLAARTGEIHERRTRQRTSTALGENSGSSAPTAPEQRGQHSGGLNAEQDPHLQEINPTPNRGHIIIIPDSALEGRVPQVLGDPRIRTRLTSEVC